MHGIMIGFDHSTVLNNELNWSNTDWAKEASEIKSLLAKNQNNKSKKSVHKPHHFWPGRFPAKSLIPIIILKRKQKSVF